MANLLRRIYHKTKQKFTKSKMLVLISTNIAMGKIHRLQRLFSSHCLACHLPLNPPRILRFRRTIIHKFRSNMLSIKSELWTMSSRVTEVFSGLFLRISRKLDKLKYLIKHSSNRRFFCHTWVDVLHIFWEVLIICSDLRGWTIFLRYFTEAFWISRASKRLWRLLCCGELKPQVSKNTRNYLAKSLIWRD